MGDRLLVSTRKGLFDFRRNSNSQGGWAVERASFLGDNVTLSRRDPRNSAIYAALDHGHFGVKLHRSLDDGETWEELPAPTYPEDAILGPNFMDPKRQPKPASLQLIWAIAPGGADQPGRLWVGTLPGGLFRSDDRGESWTFIRSLWDREERQEWFGGGRDEPGIHTILVDPRHSKRVTIAVSCGGVWETTDDGESWTLLGEGMHAEYMPPDRSGDARIQDPHIISRCISGDPDVMWTQHHNGIFRSTDAGKNWTACTDVKPSHFGFAVAAHPTDSNTAWFVPAIKDEKRIPVDGQVVVTRTRDGGQTFETLRNGLPQEHAYDIVFRHALVVDEQSGEHLAFGSTTGSLWSSDNGGESWETLTTSLPPIYAVEMA